VLRPPTNANTDFAHPLPLLSDLPFSCLVSAWKVLPADKQPIAAPQLVTPLVGLLTAAGLNWSTWLSLVTLAAALTAAAAGGGGSNGSNGYVVALVPLAGGLVHVLQHSTISQVKRVAAGGGGGLGWSHGITAARKLPGPAHVAVYQPCSV
jgi:hypothetical protein